MLTMQKIREDLKDIRYYYAKQKVFNHAAPVIGECAVQDKAARYNAAVQSAPARLYDVYVSLYVNNNTQEALAYDWNFSVDYVKQLNKQLCVFLQGALL